MIAPTDHGAGIHAIDADYGPQANAVHLIEDAGELAIVDCGVNGSVPRILEAIAAIGRAPADVRYLVLSHVHLDHAGGAGLLMARLPAATAVVHPRGAPHLIAPARLIDGAGEVYGEARFTELYGTILPIPAERVLAAQPGTRLELGRRTLVTHDAPGHCLHHHVIQDLATGGVFTGDAFGLSYREFDRDGMNFIFPSTSPVQFDPDAFHRTIDRIAGLAPPAVYVTHFSQARDVPRLAADLHRLVDEHAGIALAMEAEFAAAPDQPCLAARLQRELAGLARREARRQGWRTSDDELLRVLAIDLELNALGLASWLQRRQRERARHPAL